MKKFLILLSILLIPIISRADFSVILENNQDQYAGYTMLWIDHPAVDKYPMPFPVAGGELTGGPIRKYAEFVKDAPRKIDLIDKEPGKYVIVWTLRGKIIEQYIIATKDTIRVHIYPDRSIITYKI